MDIKRYPRESLRDEKGMILVVSLMLISVLLLLGTTAVMTSTTDMKISANYKTGIQASYVAEAGIEEARARMGADFLPATGATGQIVDSSPTSTTWSVSIGGAGPYTSIQSALVYTVSIVHQKNAANQILYWGDVNGDGLYERTTSPTSITGLANKNIYLVTSNGVAANANKTIEVEMAKLPPITVPGALYVNASTSIIGNANINGNDQCGTDATTNVPGVVSSLAPGTVDKSNNSTVTGTGGSPSITYNHPVLSVRTMIDSQKQAANYTYNVVSATHTGMSWGTPTLPSDLSQPSSCSVQNIVYYNTHNGSNYTDIKLAGGTTGCGILLVDGDLDINGGFSWYGVILVSGSVKYTGGGSKNVTGGVIAGGSVIADVVGGNSNIVYCSSAVNSQTENKPFSRLSWKEQNI